MQGYFDLNKPRTPHYCPVCQEWLSGDDRAMHMERHIEPATAARITGELGISVEDFVGFCLQEGFDLDGLSPDDPEVVNALAYWKVGGDFADADVIGEIVECSGRQLVVVEGNETFTFDLGELTFVGEVGDLVRALGRRVEGIEGMYIAGDIRFVEDDEE